MAVIDAQKTQISASMRCLYVSHGEKANTGCNTDGKAALGGEEKFPKVQITEPVCSRRKQSKPKSKGEAAWPGLTRPPEMAELHDSPVKTEDVCMSSSGLPAAQQSLRFFYTPSLVLLLPHPLLRHIRSKG
jgi:hypothetical protein